MMSTQFLAVALTTFVSSTVARSCEAITPAFEPTWGSGFSGRVLLNDLNEPRGIIFDSANNLLVVEQGSGGVRHITLTDNDADDLCVANSKKLIDAQSVCRKL